ncbi:MAG TPA: hypothetical protein VN228_13755 [Pyrinomonadaceae bacterium]|nr:hypothetical protein [Pyrinomonadaceae bacterium]
MRHRVLSRGSWLPAMIVLSLAPLTAAAGVAHQIHPNLARGAGDDKTVSRHGPDGVNLFNGNLSLSLPLGVKYPLTPDFSYQLTLHYNSNAWDLTRTAAGAIAAAPVKNSNAGLGWDLSLGRLIGRYEAGNDLGRWVFVSPDGTMRPFYDTLHEDVAEASDLVFYTRDGSYLRLKEASGAVTVESPDGTIRTFTLFADGWKLTRIADRFAGHLSISYGANLWTLTDNHGRAHAVHFKADASGVYPALVDRVVLAAFGGTNAAYTFAYTNGSAAPPDTDDDPATPALLTVPLLESVTSPDGSKHLFTYGWRVPSAGRLMTMRLPTYGSVEWSYQNYQFTSAGCPTALGPGVLRNYGVVRRTVATPAGGVAGAWAFAPALAPATSAGVCVEEREFSNTVQTPLGDKHVHYFSVNTQGAGAGWSKSDYALSGTRNATDATGARLLARKVLDCDGAGNNCVTAETRYVRHAQDAAPDPARPDVASSTNRREVSERIVYNDDVEGGVERFADTDRGDFDGLGHFRRVTTGGNFGRGDVVERYADYDAAAGTYPSASYRAPGPSDAWVLNTVGRTRVVEGASAQTVDFCHDRDTGFLRRVRKYHSTAPSGAASSRDVVVVYTPDAAGQAVVEQHYGGDPQWVGTAALCSLSVPVTDQHQIRHAFQHGARSASRYYTSSAQPFGPRFVDRDIDRNTGLVSTSRDSAGIATQYEYDAVGHATWVRPAAGHGAWTQYAYTPATGGDPSQGAKKVTYEFPNGGGAALTYHAEVQGAFGRLYWEHRLMPDATYPDRYRSHNAMGMLTHTSEYNVGAPKYTLYLDHDPFGRARVIRPPDGAHHDIRFERAGVRKVRRTVPTAVSYSQTTGAIDEQPRAVTQVFDRQGRLWKEIRHAVDRFGTPRDAVTEHFHDAAGNLLETKVDGVRQGALNAYDGRGFLSNEYRDQQNGNETVSHTSLDALGRARRTQRHNHALGSVTTYDSAYDRAGRLTKVFDTNNTAKVWKEFAYADANGANDWRAGKLWKTKRYNHVGQHWPEVGTAVVSETYTHGGKGGRLSRADIEFSDQVGRLEKFYQTYAYDDLGNVTEIGYPANDGGSIGIGRTRKVTNAYARGRLTSVAGAYNGQAENWASAVSYHPSGLNKQVAHANGVTDHVAADPAGMPRPASVTTTGARDQFGGPADFNSGAFEYDGAGRLVKAGGEVFVRGEGDAAPPEPPPYQSLCDTGWRDPFGLTYAAYDAPCSVVKIFYYYTADDRLFKIEDGVRGEKVWYFQDPDGRPLTTHTMVHGHRLPWANTWQSTKDFIYRGRFVVATDERRRDDAPRVHHYHVGHGSRGMRTDPAGRRVE